MDNGTIIETCMALIEGCFSRLQTLDIKPTLSNTETLLQTLYDLRDAHNNLKEVTDDGRAKTGI